MMMLSHLIGNDPIKAYLTKILDQEAIPHTFLFSGIDGLGKRQFALNLAKSLLKQDNHPDLFQYYPIGKMGIHTIESMKKFSQEVNLAPLQAKWKIFILHDAERMQKDAQNALLKTLEEPAKHRVIILLSSKPAFLIPTIISRSITLAFQPIPKKELAEYLEKKYALNGVELEKILRLSEGSIGLAQKLIEGKSLKLWKELQPILSHKVTGFHEIRTIIKNIIKQLNEQQEPGHINDPFYDNMTVIQKEEIQKVEQGSFTIDYHYESERLFTWIIAWYRDLECLKFDGAADQLIHADLIEELHKVLQLNKVPPLESVIKWVGDAKSAFYLSKPLDHCLETLFLHLGIY